MPPPLAHHPKDAARARHRRKADEEWEAEEAKRSQTKQGILADFAQHSDASIYEVATRLGDVRHDAIERLVRELVDEGKLFHSAPQTPLRERREAVYEKLTAIAERTRKDRRTWFSLAEIADVCGRILGSLSIDHTKRSEAVKKLRASVLEGNFENPNGRSRLAFLHASPLARVRFEREWAADLDQFTSWLHKIWMKRADCRSWHDKVGLEWPADWDFDTASTGNHEPANDVDTKLESDSAHVPKKLWKAKLGNKLTAHEEAIVNVLNKICPDGNLDYKAAIRNRRIMDQLKDLGGVSERVIQRALRKIHFS